MTLRVLGADVATDHAGSFRDRVDLPDRAAPAGAADCQEPRFCPFCGLQGSLKPCSGAGFIEKGCYIGGTYCYEGDLPGYFCQSCKRDFSLDVDDDEVHAACACAPRECDCDQDDPHMKRPIEADAPQALPVYVMLSLPPGKNDA